jgi:hypothetical protein
MTVIQLFKIGGKNRRFTVQGQPRQKLAIPLLNKQAGHGDTHLWSQLFRKQRQDCRLRLAQAKRSGSVAQMVKC